MNRSPGITAALTVFAFAALAASPARSGEASRPRLCTERPALRSRPSKQGRGIRRQEGRSKVELGRTTNSAQCAFSYTWGARYRTFLVASSMLTSCLPRCERRVCFGARREAEVITTAVGLMAASELKIASPEMVKEAIGFLGKNAQGVRGSSDWRSQASSPFTPPRPIFRGGSSRSRPLRQPDGAFGQEPFPAKPYATGGAAAAILRMGLKLENRDAVINAIKAGQRPEGAWSKDDSPPDLGASYRVMRALYMLREKPDVDRLLSFVKGFRQSDGSYASKPGGAGDLGGAYTATIIVRWARLLSGLPPVIETAGFTPLVDAKDLTGWEGDKTLWSVRDGVLIGHSPGINHNEFLATTRPFGDFIVSLNFRLVDGKGNSGVQFRSIRIANREMSGYQADIGEGYWGSLYDESRRNKVLVPASQDALKALNKTDWNHYTVRAVGDRISLGLGGAVAVNYRETEPQRSGRSGLLAVQLHAGGSTEIQFKDMMIQAIPAPTTDNPDAPGFHLRTVKTELGERKYTVYVPEGYNGSRVFPVILFLHGSSARGEDGIMPAQNGLGPAILGRPGGVPAVVVFPQARETWAAGSADSKTALAVLGDVMTRYATNPARVILTGLSMGGRGSWELASAHPERFAAVVPVCGTGRPGDVTGLKSLPVWSFCGDADRDSVVLDMRKMIESLTQEGARARLTEYRGVGHNSWDRAYNDPELIDWMLEQHKH